MSVTLWPKNKSSIVLIFAKKKYDGVHGSEIEVILPILIS